ncbi:MAG: ribosome-associated translation inhibitor RaiA [Thermomicrobiales bacterium]
MDIQVRSNGVATDDALLDFVNRRVAKLDRLVDRESDAKLELRGNHNRVGPEMTTAQITIRSGGDVLRAEQRAADPKLAIDQAIDKLERQIRRVHDKRAQRRSPGQPTIRTEAIEEAFRDDSFGDDGDLKALVRTKRFDLKPMDVDEAIEQMELVGHDFFLFHYADEDIPSVVYRRRDGSFGLIIPKAG